HTYLGFSNVTTDAGCYATFGPLTLPVPPGQTVFTATATDPYNNTSEFSQCFAILPPTVTPTPTLAATSTPTPSPTPTPNPPVRPGTRVVTRPVPTPAPTPVFLRPPGTELRAPRPTPTPTQGPSPE